MELSTLNNINLFSLDTFSCQTFCVHLFWLKVLIVFLHGFCVNVYVAVMQICFALYILLNKGI